MHLRLDGIAEQLRDLAAQLDYATAEQTKPDIEAEPYEDISRGNLYLSPAGHVMWWRDRLVPSMTRLEFGVVHVLARRPGWLFNREHLLSRVWPDPSDISDRAVDTAVKRIRIKFRSVDPEFSNIRTLHGMGYMWSD